MSATSNPPLSNSAINKSPDLVTEDLLNPSDGSNENVDCDDWAGFHNPSAGGSIGKHDRIRNKFRKLLSRLLKKEMLRILYSKISSKLGSDEPRDNTQQGGPLEYSETLQGVTRPRPALLAGVFEQQSSLSENEVPKAQLSDNVEGSLHRTVNMVDHSQIPESQSSPRDFQDVRTQLGDLPRSDTVGLSPNLQPVSHATLSAKPTTPLEQYNTDSQEDSASPLDNVRALRQNLDGQSLQETSEASPIKNKLETVFKIDLRKANGEHLIRLGKLDTGADVNLICNEIVRELGIKIEEIPNALLRGVGNTIKPEGKITIVWNVVGKAKTYTDEFLVVNEDQARGFDCLIGEETISRVGFLKRDHNVYFLDYGH